MQFLYPTVLWSLAALAIPIVVHLFNFRRAKLVKFSNVRYLEVVKKETTKTRNIKHLLILLSRLLLLFFLILAFAQPYFPGKEEGLSGSEITLFVDNSWSMSNTKEQNMDGLAVAVNLTEQVLNLYPDGTQFKLITNDFAPSSNHFRSKGTVLDEVMELQYSNVPRDGNEILNRIFRGQIHKKQDYFIISDFSKINYENVQKIQDSSSSIHVIPIQFESYKNIFIDSVYLGKPFVIKGQNNRLHATITNHNSIPQKDIIVKLLINERQTSSLSTDLGAFGSSTVSFDLTDVNPKNTGRIVIEDYPIIFDNEFYFTFDISSGIRIVEIGESSEVTSVQQVFAKNELFDFSNYGKTNISYDQLQKADLVILNELESAENGLISQVSAKLDKENSVVIIPHSNIPESDLSQIIGYPVSRESQETMEQLESPDIQHPFFQNVFEEVDESSMMPSVKIIWNSLAPKDVLLKSKTSAPFLSHLYQQGKLFFFSTPFDPAYTNFHRNSLIVPVMQRIAEQSSHNNQSLYYNIGDASFEVNLDVLVQNSLYKMVQGDEELVVSQRVQGNTLMLDPPKYLLSPGYYNITSDDQDIHTLAVNHHRSESRTEPMDMGALKEKFSGFQNLEFYDEIAPENFSKSLKEKYDKVELWKYALILCLIFVIIEVFLIRFL